MPLLWSGIALVVLGVVLTAQELRWFHTERSAAVADALCDLLTRHVIKAAIGPALMLAGRAFGWKLIVWGESEG